MQAINDYHDSGNLIDFDRKPFDKDKTAYIRPLIELSNLLEQSSIVIQMEIEDYFLKYQEDINWRDFWEKCKIEFC